jgi:demethylmenaquinone methyltransferase/2-methoxy-6-polyprenyl-1,4-benzoquinol methylase
MNDQPSIDGAASLLASQRTYYDERADEYGEVSKPDRKGGGMMSAEVGRALVDELTPIGDVLELACGTGFFTREIVRHARTVTVVDASPHMLAIAQRRLGDHRVRYVEADIFAWEPDRAYDAVFFGCWLSHVPPTAFDDFWALVRRCLAPSGRVAFVDEDDRAAGHDDPISISGVPAALRTLSDGRQFEIVKVFWRPEDLEERLRSSGWDIDVRRVGETFLYGVGQSQRST